MRAFRRGRLIRLGAFVVLLGAILPNVLYVGHLPSESHSHIRTPAEAQEHAEHCHIGPSKCSGQASFVGTWWIGDAEWSISHSGRPRQIELGEYQPLQEPELSIDTPPPRFA